MNNSSLQFLLGKNVIELTFVRRHKCPKYSDIRALFGTTNSELLNSDFGFQVFRFRPPKGVGMGYDYRSKNLCVVWDIFRQSYRVFGAEQVQIRKQWDVSTPEGIEAFKEYFYTYIYTLSEQDKLDFMGYTGQFNIIQNPKISPETKSGIFSDITKKFSPFFDRIKQFFTKKS